MKEQLFALKILKPEGHLYHRASQDEENLERGRVANKLQPILIFEPRRCTTNGQ